MDNIEKLFNEKNFDEKSKEVIINFIDKFDKYFGKYLSTDEVLDRIKNNLDAIVFEDIKSKNGLGTYNGDEKVITIQSGLEEKKEENCFFHEMIHCLTARGNENGFKRKYGDKWLGRGFNEGFTQYITKKSDSSIEYESREYPILSTVVEDFAKLIGEDEFLDIGFTKPEQLMSKLEGIMYEPERFLESMDIIHKYEGKIFSDKRIAAFEQILFKKQISSRDDDIDLEFAKKDVMNTFSNIIASKQIINVKEFEENYKLLSMASKDLDTKIDLMDFDNMIMNIANYGIPYEEIIEVTNKYSSIIEDESEQNYEEIEEDDFDFFNDFLSAFAKEGINETDLKKSYDTLETSLDKEEKELKGLDEIE